MILIIESEGSCACITLLKGYLEDETSEWVEELRVVRNTSDGMMVIRVVEEGVVFNIVSFGITSTIGIKFHCGMVVDIEKFHTDLYHSPLFVWSEMSARLPSKIMSIVGENQIILPDTKDKLTGIWVAKIQMQSTRESTGGI